MKIEEWEQIYSFPLQNMQRTTIFDRMAYTEIGFCYLDSHSFLFDFHLLPCFLTLFIFLLFPLG